MRRAASVSPSEWPRRPSGPTPRRPARFGPGDRVRRKSEYDRVFEDGVRLAGKLVAITALAKQGGHGRLGIAAGRSLGSAPVRNRVRRRVRELFRQDTRLRAMSLDLVVSLRAPAAAADFSALAEEFGRLSDRLRRRLGDRS